jgi:hypothetical protein
VLFTSQADVATGLTGAGLSLTGAAQASNRAVSVVCVGEFWLGMLFVGS